MIKCPGWLVPVPHDNQLASNAPPLKGMEEEVCGIAWLCDPDRAVGECNTETNDGIGSVERLRSKNLSPVAKRMESSNKVLHADLARGGREEKNPWQWQKFRNFQRWCSGCWNDGTMVLMKRCCWTVVCNGG